MNPSELPRYFGLVKLVAQIGAWMGVSVGVVSIIGALLAFRVNAAIGLATLAGGVAAVLVSLAGLGMAYCFLAMVQAQIESRHLLAEIKQQLTSTGGRSD